MAINTESRSLVFNQGALSGKQRPAASEQEETAQAQLEPSQSEEADDLDRSFSEAQEADLSKPQNVAVRTTEAAWAIQEWDLEAQQPERWLEDFLALQTPDTHATRDQEDQETWISLEAKCSSLSL